MLNFAVIGCGSMAHWHAAELKKMSAEVNVVALCDTRPEQTALFKEKYFPNAQEFTDFDTLLAKPPKPLDAVVLVTPHSLHYPHAKAALLAGINVLVEKPMVTNSDHAYDLWKTQTSTGKHLGITFQACYTPEYQYIKSLRESGQLGKVQLVSGWLAQSWLTNTANTWRQIPATSGGGQMYDSGAHILNGIMWLLNEPVVEVACFYDKLTSPVDINGVAILKFQSGALGSIAIGGNSPGWNVSINIQTDRLQIATRPHGGSLEITGEPTLKYPHVPTSTLPGAFTPHRNFVQTLLKTENPQVTPRHGVLLSTLMDALYQSAHTQSIIQVKPVPENL